MKYKNDLQMKRFFTETTQKEYLTRRDQRKQMEKKLGKVDSEIEKKQLRDLRKNIL